MDEIKEFKGKDAEIGPTRDTACWLILLLGFREEQEEANLEI